MADKSFDMYVLKEFIRVIKDEKYETIVRLGRKSVVMGLNVLLKHQMPTDLLIYICEDAISADGVLKEKTEAKLLKDLFGEDLTESYMKNYKILNAAFESVYVPMFSKMSPEDQAPFLSLYCCFAAVDGKVKDPELERICHVFSGK